MARLFVKASVHDVEFNTAGQSFQTWGYGTVAAVVRRTAVTNGADVILANENTAHDDDGFAIYYSTTDNYEYWTAAPDANGFTCLMGVNGPAAGQWSIFAITKATGSATATGHLWVQTTNTWTHLAFLTASNDNTATGLPVKIGGGFYGTDSAFDGDIAAVMVLNNRAMTNSEIEKLPRGLWDQYVTRTDDLYVEFPNGRDNVIPGVATVRSNDRGQMKSTTITGTARTVGRDMPGFRFSRLHRRR